MSQELASRVIVCGSINIDIFTQVSRLPQKGETVVGDSISLLPGGKGANQAVAAAKFGATVHMIGKVGDDHFGPSLVSNLVDAGVNVDHVASVPSLSSGTAMITLQGNDNSIIVIPGANDAIEKRDVMTFPLKASDVLVSQFETPLPVIESFFRQGKAQGAQCVLNAAPAKPIPPSLLELTDILVLNETELSALSGTPVHAETADATLLKAAARVVNLLEQTVIVTLGPKGLAILGRNVDVETKVERVLGQQVSVVDTTGAGDCFVGNLSASLAAGWSLKQSAIYANRAAALSIQTLGAIPAMPSRELVEASMES